MFTLGQYLFSLEDPCGLLRTLGGIRLCRDASGRLRYTAGNSAAVFRIVGDDGQMRALRCWFRPMPRLHLRAIYGEQLRERELFLYTGPDSGQWVDVALTDWIEGTTLHRAAAEAARAHDRTRLGALSAAFDRLAGSLVADDEAHGDLKPENIIVDVSGALRPIDFDARFLPAFAQERSPELGTAAYQHPARTADDFDASIDDYPAAAISTALAALALDPALYARYGDRDGLLLTPRLGTADPARCEALALFERAGDAPHYRLARLLESPSPRLYRIAELFAATAPTPQPAQEPQPAQGPPPELFVREGLWGFRRGERIVIPPLYDEAFDFTEGLAAVRLRGTWHYIDPSGRTCISLPGCEAVKPFRDGEAVILRAGRRLRIDRRGNRIG